MSSFIPKGFGFYCNLLQGSLRGSKSQRSLEFGSRAAARPSTFVKWLCWWKVMALQISDLPKHLPRCVIKRFSAPLCIELMWLFRWQNLHQHDIWWIKKASFGTQSSYPVTFLISLFKPLVCKKIGCGRNGKNNTVKGKKRGKKPVNLNTDDGTQIQLGYQVLRSFLLNVFVILGIYIHSGVQKSTCKIILY